MTLREANYEVERLNNELNKLLKDKEILECVVSPKSTDYTRVMVDGGKHCNTLGIYILKQDLPRWKGLDSRIKKVQEQIKNNLDWIDEELRILKKYNEIEQSIIYYKEIDTKRWTWHQISTKVSYSIAQCKRIYSRYKQKRNIN